MYHPTYIPLALVAILLSACGGTNSTDETADDAALRTPESQPDADEDASPQQVTIRIFSEEWIDALESTYSSDDYPALETVLDAYEVSKAEPTEANYRAAEDARWALVESLSPTHRQAFGDVDRRVQSMVFARVHVFTKKEIADRFAQEFSESEYPLLAAFEETAAALRFNNRQSQDAYDRHYRNFLDSLAPADRERALDVEAEIRDAWGMR